MGDVVAWRRVKYFSTLELSFVDQWGTGAWSWVIV